MGCYERVDDTELCIYGLRLEGLTNKDVVLRVSGGQGLWARLGITCLSSLLGELVPNFWDYIVTIVHEEG